MKLIILGTNGFLSTILANCYMYNGYEIEMYGLETPVHNQCSTYHPINLMHEEFEYDKLLHSDVIIYTIGAGIQSNLKENHDLIYNLNVTVPTNLCKVLDTKEYKGIFVTFGSVFEMGETKKKHFFTENEIIQSVSPAPNDYTVSKRMFTRFITSCKLGIKHWHFILPTIYGETENPTRLIPYTINALRNGDRLRFTSGDQVRQYVYGNEISRLIDEAYRKDLPSGVYNVQGKETITIRELVTLICNTLNKKVPEDCFGATVRTDVGMKYLALDGSKLKQAIGFEASLPLTEMIKKY